MPESSTLNLEARLAVLEERTTPKPKTLYEKIKDWSGVLTFVMAVLYTYPLGVWDRFVVTAKEQRAKEVADLRSLILKLAEADSDSVRGLSSIADVQAQATWVQIANGRKAAIIAPSIALVEKHYAALSGAELELIGYHLNQLGDQGVLVNRVFEKAIEKMVASKNMLGAADTYRMQAALYGPWGSLGTDMQKSRDFQRMAVNVLLVGDPSKSIGGAIAVALDWSNSEAAAGSWPCSEQLANWVIAQYQYSSPAYAQSLQSQLAQQAIYRKSTIAPWIPVNQGNDVCSKDIFPWTAIGWPWTPAK
jgi:hypothetical protein